jgi:hypothetical protein
MTLTSRPYRRDSDYAGVSGFLSLCCESRL